MSCNGIYIKTSAKVPKRAPAGAKNVAAPASELDDEDLVSVLVAELPELPELPDAAEAAEAAEPSSPASTSASSRVYQGNSVANDINDVTSMAELSKRVVYESSVYVATATANDVRPAGTSVAVLIKSTYSFLLSL